MVAVTLSLRYPAQAFLDKIKAYDRAVTTPAMLAAWGFGILLAAQGAWFMHSWLALKILLVLILSGLHGVLAGKLRRSTSGISGLQPSGHSLLPFEWVGWIGLFGLALVTLIVLLVTLKP